MRKSRGNPMAIPYWRERVADGTADAELGPLVAASNAEFGIPSRLADVLSPILRHRKERS